MSDVIMGLSLWHKGSKWKNRLCSIECLGLKRFGVSVSICWRAASPRQAYVGDARMVIEGIQGWPVFVLVSVLGDLFGDSYFVT